MFLGFIKLTCFLAKNNAGHFLIQQTKNQVLLGKIFVLILQDQISVFMHIVMIILAVKLPNLHANWIRADYAVLQPMKLDIKI